MLIALTNWFSSSPKFVFGFSQLGSCHKYNLLEIGAFRLARNFEAISAQEIAADLVVKNIRGIAAT